VKNENIFIICKINQLELSLFFGRTSPYSFMTTFSAIEKDGRQAPAHMINLF